MPSLGRNHQHHARNRKNAAGVDSLDSRIAATADSIAALQSRVEAMRQAYASALRSTQGSNGAMNTLAFIFSSETFSHAWQRVRYLQRFGQWRRNQTERISRAADSLELHRLGLDTSAASAAWPWHACRCHSGSLRHSARKPTSSWASSAAKDRRSKLFLKRKNAKPAPSTANLTN